MLSKWRWLLVVLVVGAVWIIGGITRADGAARTWFANVYPAGVTVTNVTVDGMFPAIPPFWQVEISGDVIEAGQSHSSYRSYMNVWIEPITGFGFLNGSG